jgi:hypothetical protein
MRLAAAAILVLGLVHATAGTAGATDSAAKVGKGFFGQFRSRTQLKRLKFALYGEIGRARMAYGDKPHEVAKHAKRAEGILAKLTAIKPRSVAESWIIERAKFNLEYARENKFNPFPGSDQITDLSFTPGQHRPSPPSPSSW